MNDQRDRVGMRRLGCLVALIGLWALWACPADAKRVALVVGINAYDNLNAEQQLRKAVNDARAIATTLKDVGFEVIAAEDATRTEFLRSWQRFLDIIKLGARGLRREEPPKGTLVMMSAGTGQGALDALKLPLPVRIAKEHAWSDGH